MQTDTKFHAAYRALEERMKARAEADGDVYLPNSEPREPVQHVLICMEPSLGPWARTKDQAEAKIAAGFRNFLSSIDTTILHHCARRYLCKSGERYHITDLSKGAMLVSRAGTERFERYKRWYSLLHDELEIVASPGANIIAVGNVVADHLLEQGFPRPFKRVMHYSAQAGNARRAAIRGREAEFGRFEKSASMDDLIETATAVLKDARVPEAIRDDELSRLKKRSLTMSRKQLIFAYKSAFESYGDTGAPR